MTDDIGLVFDLLSNARRRVVVRHLTSDGDRDYAFDRLVDVVAAEETGKDPSDINSPERNRVHVALYQTHLKRLEKAGVIAWDGETRHVAPTEKTFEYAAVIDAAADVLGGDGRGGEGGWRRLIPRWDQ